MSASKILIDHGANCATLSPVVENSPGDACFRWFTSNQANEFHPKILAPPRSQPLLSFISRLTHSCKWNSIYKTLFLIPFSFFTQLKLSTQSFTTYYQKSILSIVSNTITLILSLLDFLIAAMSSCQEEDSRRTKGLLGTIDGTIGSAVCRNKSKERVAPFTGPVFSRSP